jgi:hypothetical protein
VEAGDDPAMGRAPLVGDATVEEAARLALCDGSSELYDEILRPQTVGEPSKGASKQCQKRGRQGHEVLGTARDVRSDPQRSGDER